MLKKLLAAAVGALLILVCYPAFAQEVAKPVIDFSPIINELAMALAAVVSAGVLYLVKIGRDWLKAKTGVELQISDQQVRDLLDGVIAKGIALVMGSLNGKAKLTVSNAQIAQIANYVIASVPGALANFGITPERLQDMIRARINAWTDGPAAGLSTPPVVPSVPEVVPVPATPAP